MFLVVFVSSDFSAPEYSWAQAGLGWHVGPGFGLNLEPNVGLGRVRSYKIHDLGRSRATPSLFMFQPLSRLAQNPCVAPDYQLLDENNRHYLFLFGKVH
jgi:hypothetical protein